MAILRIEGGRRLEGRVAVEGNKNAALPLLAACLLTEEECVLTNVPRIRDVEVLVDLLVGLGADRRGSGDVDASGSLPDGHDRIGPIPHWLAGCVARSCCLGRCWHGAGRRAWRSPEEIFRRGGPSQPTFRRSSAMGAVPLEEPGHALDAPWGLSGASFYLDEASVTGTETALLAAAAAKGRTEIRHAAMEPHVAELCRFLRAMGVAIEGEGTSTIRVESPSRFRARAIGSTATTSRLAAGVSLLPSPAAASR